MEIIRKISKFCINTFFITKYKIHDDTIIFDDDFNDSLDNYYWLIARYPILSFKRPHPIKNHASISPNKSMIVSVGDFNKPIILLDNLVKVIFSDRFNQPITLSKNLNTLILGNDFDKQLKLSKKLYVLYTGRYFNYPINLTKNLRDLKLGFAFRRPLKLSKNQIMIRLSYMFNIPLEFSKKIKYITLGSRFNQSFEIPKHCVRLILSNDFNQPLILTKHIKQLIFRSCYKYSIAFESKINLFQVGTCTKCKCPSRKIYNLQHREQLKTQDNLPNGLIKIMRSSDIDVFSLNELPNDVRVRKGKDYWNIKNKYVSHAHT